MSSRCVTLHNGVLMPIIGCGTFNAEGDELRNGLKTAFEIGFRHIDTAVAYENERIVGEALKQWFDSGSGKREDFFITTKLCMGYHRRHDVERSLKMSLEKLQLDYVDLFLVHSPMGTVFSDGKTMDYVGDHCIPDNVDHLETWKGMEDVFNKGMTRAIGLSNYNIPQMQRVLDNCTIKPHNVQDECHIYLPQFEIVEFCKKHNIAFTAYSPLGSPGRGTHPTANLGVDNSKQLNPLACQLAKEIAAKHGKSTAQILLKWLLQRDIIVVPKSTIPAELQENFNLFDFELRNEEMKALSELKTRQRIFPFWWARNHPQYPFEKE
uniref:Aldo_ket_red domain-containing protein n=1 Tax=Trichuris muris TaxID=70415 RepID=A0A5S6QN23_TRIMR